MFISSLPTNGSVGANVQIDASSVLGGTAGALLFVSSGGLLTQDPTKLFYDIANDQLVLGANLAGGVTSLYIVEHATSNLIMGWASTNYARSVLWSTGGCSVNTTDWHVNLSSSATPYAIQEDDAAARRTQYLLDLQGSASTRTFPMMRIRLGATPGAGGHALTVRTSADAEVMNIASDGSLTSPKLSSTANLALNAPLGSSVQFTINSVARWSVSSSSGLAATATRFQMVQGADIGSANDLTLGSDGNVFEITGTTQVNRIANTNWQNGSVVTLLFTSNPVVAHGQASAGSNITILLAGAANFNATAGDNLMLMLCEIGGTQAWREVGRTVI